MGTSPAATAAADPPELPPGTRPRSCGFSVGPKAEFSVEEPIANSSMFVLATTTAPASLARRTAVASNGERYPSRIFEPHVVVSSVVAMLSFTTIGTPASGPVERAARGPRGRRRRGTRGGRRGRTPGPGSPRWPPPHASLKSRRSRARRAAAAPRRSPRASRAPWPGEVTPANRSGAPPRAAAWASSRRRWAHRSCSGARARSRKGFPDAESAAPVAFHTPPRPSPPATPRARGCG
jgi:hypothetical protein